MARYKITCFDRDVRGEEVVRYLCYSSSGDFVFGWRLPQIVAQKTLRKRYRGTSELILDTDSEGNELGDEDTDEGGEDESLDADDEIEKERLDDEDHGLEEESLELEEEVVPEGQQKAVLVTDTTVGKPLGLGYGALRRCELAMEEEDQALTLIQTALSHEWSSGSLPILPSSPLVSSPIASLVATLTATISVDEDQFIEVGVQLELHESILHDHTQCLDALPPTFVADIDRDVRELYTRPLLALEAWAGQTDAQRAALWHAIYDTQRENHDLRMKLAEERRERLELADRASRIERRQEAREEH
nr:hypothetical protein [Tanacetum cinerariifolium]